MTLVTPITHVIFDLDGTLLDTEPAYLAVGTQIAERYGRVFTPAIRERMVGRPGIVSARIFVEALDVPLTPEDFLAVREAALEPLFRACRAMPGAVELASHLVRHGIPCAIGTSSSRHTLAFKTAAHGEWLGGFGAIVSADDVEHGKPAPDNFLRAAALIGAAPESTLVFEDAPLGIEAALAAGMHVVAVPEHAFRDRVDAAHLVLDSLEAFDPVPWGLPAF